jgi:hypothetical protein
VIFAGEAIALAGDDAPSKTGHISSGSAVYFKLSAFGERPPQFSCCPPRRAPGLLGCLVLWATSPPTPSCTQPSADSSDSPPTDDAARSSPGLPADAPVRLLTGSWVRPPPLGGETLHMRSGRPGRPIHFISYGTHLHAETRRRAVSARDWRGATFPQRDAAPEE